MTKMKLTDWKEKHPDKWPDTYLHVLECRTGEEWIEPIRGNALLDLETRVRAWIKDQFDGYYRLDPPIMPRLEGDYYAKTIMDGRPPDTFICWESGGFYLEPTGKE